MTKEESSMNLDENIASTLCYVLTWVTGIIFYLLEKKNKTVRFHAMQSILTFLPLTIISWILMGPLGLSYSTGNVYGYGYYSVPTGFSVFYYLGLLISIITVILWIILMIKAYQGEKYKLPVVGDIAEKHA